MSLIRSRRNRKENWIDTKKARSPRTLMILLIVVIAAIWYLGTHF